MIYLLLIALLISHEKICCEWHPLAYTNLIVGYYSDTSTYKIRSRRKKLRHFQKNHFFSHFSRRRSPKENRHLFGEISHNPNLWSFFLWLFFDLLWFRKALYSERGYAAFITLSNELDSCQRATLLVDVSKLSRHKKIDQKKTNLLFLRPTKSGLTLGHTK